MAHTVRDWLLAALGFRTVPASVVVLATYATILVLTVLVQELPYTPSAKTLQRSGVDLEQAWQDLAVIATFPHPFNSHQNDVVREHILTRLNSVALTYPNVELVYDNVTTAILAARNSVSYAESTNVLVRIEGSSPELDALLISAHYDSVSTAPGATDDGMGTATLMQLVTYYAKHAPVRTVIFNFNNGEEDGLYGSKLFLRHPWAKQSKVFLNLEGAGAGGRPLLFRTSSTAVTRAFRSVSRPHGSSLTSDAFSLGLVRSETDFSVYITSGMEGLDLAFYQRRSLYHTKDDSIPSLGGRSALWSMLEASLQATQALAMSADNVMGGGRPVYFDILGRALVLASLDTFFVFNLLLLIVGPIVTGALLILYHRQGELSRLTAGWLRYPVAFVVNVAATLGMALLLAKLNPLITYSSPYMVLVCVVSTSYLSLYVPLSLFARFAPIHQQKSAVLLQVYSFSWILLAGSQILVRGPKVGGLFFTTFLNASAFLAVILDLLQSLYIPRSTKTLYSRAIEHQEGEAEAVETEQVTEITPLLTTGAGVPPSMEAGEDNQLFLWIIEFLLLVHTSGILMMQTILLVLATLAQTLADGSNAATVYLFVAITSVLLFVPLAPFAHKMHRSAAVVLAVLLVFSTAYNLLAFPFSTSSPLKVFFKQTMDLDTGTNLVTMAGLPQFLADSVIPEYPSSHGASVNCSLGTARAGLAGCAWSGLTPNVVKTRYSQWLHFNVTSTSARTAHISLRGQESRACRLYFDRKVNVRVDGSLDAVGTSTREVRLWSRTWGAAFEVDINWTADGQATVGRAACEWSENIAGRIPALDEALAFSPRWVEVSKADDGLVEGFKSFKI